MCDTPGAPVCWDPQLRTRERHSPGKRCPLSLLHLSLKGRTCSVRLIPRGRGSSLARAPHSRSSVQWDQGMAGTPALRRRRHILGEVPVGIYIPVSRGTVAPFQPSCGGWYSSSSGLLPPTSHQFQAALLPLLAPTHCVSSGWQTHPLTQPTERASQVLEFST